MGVRFVAPRFDVNRDTVIPPHESGVFSGSVTAGTSRFFTLATVLQLALRSSEGGHQRASAPGSMTPRDIPAGRERGAARRRRPCCDATSRPTRYWLTDNPVRTVATTRQAAR